MDTRLTGEAENQREESEGAGKRDLFTPGMDPPRGAVVPCFCGNYVGRPNLLLHLAGRPIRKTREGSRCGKNTSGGVDGSQRRVLQSRETEIPRGPARVGPLVSLGSFNDVGQRNGAACPRLLLHRRTP